MQPSEQPSTQPSVFPTLHTCVDSNFYWNGEACVAYFSAGVSGSGPGGIWRAEHYNSDTSTLVEARRISGREVVASGDDISIGRDPGAGATANVSWIGGGSSSRLSWNAVPSSSLFTICAITRYTGELRGRVLASDSSDNWLFGHFEGKRGVAYFNEWMTSESQGTVTNWLVMCGQNGASTAAPNNILADGTINRYDF